MKNFISISIFLFLLFPSGLFTEEISVKSNINSVVVYYDRAEVSREVSLKVKAGLHNIIFEKLPASIIPQSVRVYGAGTTSAKLLGIEVEKQFFESPFLPEIRKIESKIKDLEYEIKKMKDEIDILISQEGFIKSIQTKTAEKASQEIALAKPDPISWEKAMSFFESKLLNIRKLKLELEKKIEESNKELSALKKKLESITPNRHLEGKKVSVMLDVSKEGELRLRLSYTTGNSGWKPLYTLRAVPESDQIDFSISSEIKQMSGENWDNVKVLLSTSTPSLEPSPPTLSPWILDFRVPRPVRKAEYDKRIALTPVEVKEEMVMEIPEAQIEEIGLHINFELPRSISIPSDGSPHKFPVDSQLLPAKFDYISIPKLTESAFLRGKLKNTLPYPIIAGNADIFISQEFVGSTQVPFTPKEDEFSLFFGRDEQIKVKYEILKKEKGSAGIFGNRERVKFAHRISLQNLRKNPVVIEVLDQIPVSQNTQIEIKDVNLNPQPSKKDEKGILSWNLSLEPQAKKEIKIEFTVEYPKDAKISGL